MNSELKNPFPGLRPFEENETHLFFGRDKQILQLVERLRNTRFLAVIGSSGCGKSSLIRAGLFPSLRGQQESPLLRSGLSPSTYSDMIQGETVEWRPVVLRPGDSPIKSLAHGLSRSGSIDDHWQDGQHDIYTSIIETTLRHSSLGLQEVVDEARLPAKARLLILVDQFEELFRFRKHGKETHISDDAKAFVQLLLHSINDSAGRIYVILTMRSDYLGQAAALSGLPEAISESQYLVPRLSRRELRSSITGPVESEGAEITPRLVTRLLNQLGDDQDQLPVLQHALMRLWDNWQQNYQGRGQLDIEHLQKDHTIGDLLGQHADEVYSRLISQERKDIAKKIFKVLTTTNADGEGIRRPVTLEMLVKITGHDEQDIVTVINNFRAKDCCFLMPPIDTDSVLSKGHTIDISHESLMRKWTRLAAWVAEEEQCARDYRRILIAAQAWSENKGALWSSLDGRALGFAQAWKNENNPNAYWAMLYTVGHNFSLAESDFAIVNSFLELSAAEREAAIRKKKIDTIVKRGTGVALLLTGVMVAGYLFFASLEKIKSAEQLARSKITAMNFQPDPLTQALFLISTIDSNDTGYPCYKKLALKVAPECIPKAVYDFEDSGKIKISRMAIQSDGPQIAIADENGAIYVWSGNSFDEPKPIVKGEGGFPSHIAFTPDGNGLITSDYLGSLRYLPLKNASESCTISNAFPRVDTFLIDPENEKIIFSVFNEEGRGTVEEIPFSPDNPCGGDPRHTEILNFSTPVKDLSVNSEKIVTASQDGTITVSPLAGKSEFEPIPFKLPGKYGYSRENSVALSASGLLAVGTDLGLIYVYTPDVNSNAGDNNNFGSIACPKEIAGYTCALIDPEKAYGAVRGVGFIGDKIYGGYADGAVRIWHISEDEQYAKYQNFMVLRGHAYPILDIAVKADKKTLVSVDSDKELRVWDLEQFRNHTEIKKPSNVVDNHISGNGDVLSVSENGRITVLYSENADQEKTVIESAGTDITRIAYCRKKQIIATGSQNGIVTLWAENNFGKVLDTLSTGAEVHAILFNSSCENLYIGNQTNILKWSPESDNPTKKLANVIKEKAGVWALALNEAETKLTAGLGNGEILLYDESEQPKWKLLGKHQSLGSANAVTGVVFMGNDEVLSAGRDWLVRRWDIPKIKANSNEVFDDRVFEGNTAPLSIAALKREETEFTAIGNEDGSIWLNWIKKEDDDLIRVAKGQTPITHVTFSDDGKHIFATGRDGSAIKVTLDHEEILQQLEITTDACFSVVNREKYLDEESDEAEKNYNTCKKQKM
ncbi:NACHT and WD repeat domain-containing protein [Desulfosediminicola flagellatus]|uniref:NACHT and WD repeat domain-containing protein n=1 Tax=Desulfosediminicola flagellatus TaxID=2569541 RepID=UPI0010AB8BEF|nr:NACHT and WD repeat domain-containing protein [Desulfosediminicola flagellatus]